MGSANPPLAVHCLHGGRHHQRRRCGTKEVHGLAGTLSGVSACFTIFPRSVLVRAALCREVAQLTRRRLNGAAPPLQPLRSNAGTGKVGSGMETGNYCTLGTSAAADMSKDEWKLL